jgi:hypothetical protein
MSKVFQPFILTDTYTLTFGKALPEEVLTALWYMPGHIRTTVQAGRTICTFNRLYYHEDQFRDAVESVIQKVLEGEKK